MPAEKLLPINLPNILTILRLIAAPLIGLVFVVFENPVADGIALTLFIAASATDWLDGHLARAWNQTSAFGRMLDPIADKAMVVIALAVLMGLWGGHWLLLVPTVAILFREVFVSGLREFLGAQKGKLAVTNLAKWKTTVQMVAIGVLFAAGIAEASYSELYYADPEASEAVLSGAVEDDLGLRFRHMASSGLSAIGLGLLWLAAFLTVVTGWDYFAKALPLLKEESR